jgi:hypothetical protein
VQPVPPLAGPALGNIIVTDTFLLSSSDFDEIENAMTLLLISTVKFAAG